MVHHEGSSRVGLIGAFILESPVFKLGVTRFREAIKIDDGNLKKIVTPNLVDNFLFITLDFFHLRFLLLLIHNRLF